MLLVVCCALRRVICACVFCLVCVVVRGGLSSARLLLLGLLYLLCSVCRSLCMCCCLCCGACVCAMWLLCSVLLFCCVSWLLLVVRPSVFVGVRASFGVCCLAFGVW